MPERAARDQTVLESAPDAVVVVDTEGTILLVNRQAELMFGYGSDEMVGKRVEMLLPNSMRDRHVAHRARYIADPRTRPMGLGLKLETVRRDGTCFPVDISLSSRETDHGQEVIAFVRDITDRLKAEEAAQALREAELFRRQAFEINDGIVQGMTVALLSLENGYEPEGVEALRASLESARRMMSRLLADSERAEIGPGDLVRDQPARFDHP